MTWSDSKPHETLNTVIDTVNQMMGRVHPITPPLQPDKVRIRKTMLFYLPLIIEVVCVADLQEG